jgi:hypothetical protein
MRFLAVWPGSDAVRDDDNQYKAGSSRLLHSLVHGIEQLGGFHFDSVRLAIVPEN